MSTAGPPQIPPRPSRGQAEATDATQSIPKLPPRPNRRPERSVSPHRAEYTRSPLNEPPASPARNGFGYGHNLSSQDLPRRPPSTSVPAMAGEEGLEYAGLPNEQGRQGDVSTSPKQTRNVAADLPMHAPKASVPSSTANSRIQTVTRTDSSQAAAAGIGNTESSTSSSAEADSHPLRAKSSFSQSNLSVNQPIRPDSSQGEDERGIPQFGLQVPMLKYAGDVQAPSPAPGAGAHPASPGHAVEGSVPASRNHHRKRSSRHEFGPPGSYGMHGHGYVPVDNFEKAWYQRHPDELKKEVDRHYDPGHPSHDWAMSSDDLNRLVRDSASRGIGMGTSPNVVGTPSEQIGYMASEEYTSRMNSPRPTSSAGKRRSSGTQPAIASPLRKANVPQTSTSHLRPLEDDDAVESDNDIIHVDPPAHRQSKIHGGGIDPPTEDLGPEGGNTEEEGGWVVENGYGVPILASDEVAKNKDPSADYLQPAVSPEQERRGSDYYAGWDSEAPPSYQIGRRNSQSKEKSRPGSTHMEPLSRFHTRESIHGSGLGTPLHEIEEYEPLFPEDDKEPPKPKAIENLKRPDLARHQFPSQDVWEDVPESLQYQTTVDTPQEPEDLNSSTTFEPPEKEQARKEENLPTDRADFLTEETRKMAKSHFKPGVMDELGRPNMQGRFPSRDVWEDTPDSLQYQTTVETPQIPEDLESSTGTLPEEREKPKSQFNPAVAEEMRRRPDMSHRFPSQDIWEDTPDSLNLETTVGGPQQDDTNEVTSPADAKSPQDAFRKPQIPARPARPSKLSEEVKATEPQVPARPSQISRQVPPADTKVPQIPQRPSANKPPVIPDRPKPQIPTRPARIGRSDSQENVSLSKTTSKESAESAGSAKSPPEVKAKPAVPSRPVSANFAKLRAGFMNDLNSRLQLGPQAPKKEPEPAEEAKEEEKAPLADARKGRARGPARRKPQPTAAAAAAAASVPAEQVEASNKSISLAISTTFTVYQIDDEGEVSVPNLSDLASPLALADAEVELKNITSSNTDSAGPGEEASNADAVNESLADPVGAEGDSVDSSKLSSATIDRSQAIESELEAALADSRAHGETPADGATDVTKAIPEHTSEIAASAGQDGKDAATEEQKSVAMGTIDATPSAAAAPSTSHQESAGTTNEETTKMVDESAQTGEHNITVKGPEGEQESMTITLGGRAPDEGNVVKKEDGEEILGDMDEKHRTATTGHGM